MLRHSTQLRLLSLFLFFFFLHDPAPTEIYTLSLHDALPIFVLTCFWSGPNLSDPGRSAQVPIRNVSARRGRDVVLRSEEHTSELQSLRHLVCRLLLEKKKKKKQYERYT